MRTNGNDTLMASNGHVCDCANVANGYIFVNETATGDSDFEVEVEEGNATEATDAGTEIDSSS